MEAPAAYIPLDRRRAIARDEELPDRTDGAALFADISGFTPLTEALVRELGPRRGADELTKQLNTVYGALITEVHRFQGSVIGFSGDAVTCWFDADDGQRAVSCGLAMQQAMTQFEMISMPTDGVISLGMKVAVAGGPVRRFRVGDPQVQYIDVLTGATLDRMAAAEQHARKGEVVVESETVARIGNRAIITEWRNEKKAPAKRRRHFAIVAGLRSSTDRVDSGHIASSVEEPDLTEAQIRPWLLPPVYERLLSGQGHFLAEIRPAAALFLRFGGLDYDQDEAGSKLDDYIQWVQRVLARYEGYLIQLTIGDKGSYLYAVFGAPVAHDDDPIRAVAAALELRSSPAELSFISDVHIGLSQGWMRTGAYGSARRRTYGVLGNETNVAARLMSGAEPGQILVTSRIATAATRGYQFKDLGLVTLKGKPEPISVFEVLGKQRTFLQNVEPGQQTAFIGRTGEWALLIKQLRGLLQHGAGRVIIIEGEAGIGKSRLAMELVSLARNRDVRTLLGAGRSIERQTPYRVWRDIFSAYFDLDAAVDLATGSERDLTRQQARVRNLVQATAPDQIQRLPLLNDVLNLDLPDTDLTAALDPALRQQSLALFLVTLLRAWVNEQPLVLVLEDAHWLDSLSWDLALQVARALISAGAPLLLVLVIRPPDEHSAEAQHIATLRALPESTTVSLTNLSPDETEALVAARLGLSAGALPTPIANLVRQRAGGNPFYAEELIFTLRDQGFITIEPAGQTPDGFAGPDSANRCVISGDLAYAHQTLPDTVQGLVLARIDRLPSECRLVLKVGSAIGRTFGYVPLRYTLNRHTPIDDTSLKNDLDTLVAYDLTPIETPEPDLTYIFKHIITQEVTYQTLAFDQRRQLHRTIAEWYEQSYGQDGPPQRPASTPSATAVPSASAVLPLLVYHYHHAEDHERERDYARLAGEQAAAQFANEEAVTYFSRALDLTPETNYAERYALLLAREKVYELQGKRDSQQAALISLAQLAEQLDNDRKRAEVALRQSAYAEVTSDYPAAIAAAQAAIGLAQAVPDINREAQGFLNWGQALWRQGNYEEAQTRLEQALDLSAELPQLQARGLRTLGLVAWNQGNIAQALTHFEQTLRIVRQIADRQGEGLALNNLGIISAQQGDHAGARGHFEQSLLICRQIGHRQVEANVLNNLGIVAGYQSDYDGAGRYYEQALLIKREIGDRRGEAMVLDNLGDVARYQSDFAQATDYFEQSLHLRQEIGDRQGQGNVLNNLGTVCHYQGDYDRAKTYYEQSLRIRQEIGDRQGESEVLAYLCLLAHHVGDDPNALELGRQALRIAQELGDHHLEGYALTHLGHAQFGLGHLSEAAAAYQQALALRRDLGEHNRATEPLAGLVRVLMAQGHFEPAQARLEEILDHLNRQSLEGTEEPMRVYLTCYQLLRANRDPRAEAILERAYARLQERAVRLEDAALRHSFLDNVAAHREIAAAWQLSQNQR